MLQHESQNVFGGQLHSYISHMKKNYLYNYYYSGGSSKRKNGKLNLNSPAKLNKTQIFLDKYSQDDKIKNLFDQKQINKNNTTMHYTAFSSSKHKEKDATQFIKTSATSFYKWHSTLIVKTHLTTYWFMLFLFFLINFSDLLILIY